LHFDTIPIRPSHFRLISNRPASLGPSFSYPSCPTRCISRRSKETPFASRRPGQIAVNGTRAWLRSPATRIRSRFVLLAFGVLCSANAGCTILVMKVVASASGRMDFSVGLGVLGRFLGGRSVFGQHRSLPIKCNLRLFRFPSFQSLITLRSQPCIPPLSCPKEGIFS